MFGDVGQGIVLALFSTFMWKVKHNDLFHLMIPCGISSTIFGLVYGSLFGYEEALDPLYHALGMAGKPVSVMDSITGILMVAVYIGIVLVLAASAHRRAAFAAAEYLMDYLKTEAPFWKREEFADGSTHWVAARASDDAARQRWSGEAESR